MRIWFDTEFIEDGKTIDLISIGMVREDGGQLYCELSECDHSRASPWVRDNVLVHLRGGEWIAGRSEAAAAIRDFAGEKPEFWAYYADYDWVALCQLYGTMMDLPKGWPMFCRDVKQLCVDLGDPTLPKQDTTEHHALADAVWTKEAWAALATARAAAERVEVPRNPLDDPSFRRREYEVGQEVWKSGGRYVGPGVIRGYAWMPHDRYWLYNVGMRVAGGDGEFCHVFPAGILQPFEPRAARVLQDPEQGR